MLINDCMCWSDASFDGSGAQALDDACEPESVNGFIDGICCCVGNNDGMAKGLASFWPSRPGIADMNGLRSCDLEVNGKSMWLFKKDIYPKGLLNDGGGSFLGYEKNLVIISHEKSTSTLPAGFCLVFVWPRQDNHHPSLNRNREISRRPALFRSRAAWVIPHCTFRANHREPQFSPSLLWSRIFTLLWRLFIDLPAIDTYWISIAAVELKTVARQRLNLNGHGDITRSGEQ